MVVELQVQSFRCPGCGRTFEIRPVQNENALAAGPARAPSQTRPQQPKAMTDLQAGLIEDYCGENHITFPQGFAEFTADDASAWIEQNIPKEYIAWRRRKLYGLGVRA